MSVPPTPSDHWSRLTLAGLAGWFVGFIVVLAAWHVNLRVAGLPWSTDGIRAIHRSGPALFILALLPSVLGLLAVHAGRLKRWSDIDRARIAELEQRERDLLVPALIVENSIDGIISVNRRGTILRINPAAERMFGYDVHSAKGKVLADLIPDYGNKDNTGVRRRTSKRVELGTEWHLEGRHLDGTTFPIELTFYEGTGRKKGVFVYVVRDPQGQIGRLRRTNRMLKQARSRALDELQAKDRFIARVSYELRTPLNVTLGYTDMLLEDTAELGIEHIRGDLERIQLSAAAMAAVIANVLELNQLTAQSWQPLSELLDVRSLVEDIALAVRRRAQKNRNNVTIEVDSGVKTVFADGVLVRQLLLELLDNACRFTENGHIVIAAKRHSSADGEWVRLYVRDTGIGMEQEELRRALADDGDRQLGRFSSKGPVVTLALARRIARAMGGELEGVSERGKGTLLTLSLPECDPETDHLTGCNP